MSGPSDQHYVLAVCTEWDSKHGGLTTFNRQLCLALAEQGARVVCLVVAATDAERRHAAQGGVTLIDASANGEPTQSLALARKPPLPSGFVPTIIIGHSRITGPSAKALQEDHFPQARRLHVVHMSPDEIEWHKLDRIDDASTRAEARTEEELRLARNAYRVIAVGPRIFKRLENDLVPEDIVPLQIDPGFDGNGLDRSARPTPAGLCRILLFGRMEDAHPKGLDIASQAMGQVLRWRPRAAAETEFVIRGAPAHSSEQLRLQVQKWVQVPALNLVVRPYTDVGERLTADLRRASLVLMPSRVEGFGLVGLEAIAAGTPALISGTSGLGILLENTLEADDAQRIVVPMTDNDDELIDRWARAIDAVLRDRDAAFRRAAESRSELASRTTWAAAARRVLDAVGVPPTDARRAAIELLPEHRRSLTEQLILVGSDALAAAYREVASDSEDAVDWNNPSSALLRLEKLPISPGQPPRLFIFLEHLAHLRERREYKALHEWIDQVGSALGLGQEAIRGICMQERVRSSIIGPEIVTSNSPMAGEIITESGDPVAKTTMLDKRPSTH